MFLQTKMKLKLKDALLFATWVFEQNKVPSKYSGICADILISADELGFNQAGGGVAAMKKGVELR